MPSANPLAGSRLAAYPVGMRQQPTETTTHRVDVHASERELDARIFAQLHTRPWDTACALCDRDVFHHSGAGHQWTPTTD